VNNNYAFSAGVRFGGLTDRTEIKILICYLLSGTKQPLTEQQLIDTIVGQELVNYFELQDALSHLIDQQLICEENGLYRITEDGRNISAQLEKVLPFSVRERAHKALIELLQYEALKRQNKTKITPLENGGFNLNCTISDGSFVLFSFDLYMPDEKTAHTAQESFIKYGQDIFKCVLGITTENPKIYKEILENLNK